MKYLDTCILILLSAFAAQCVAQGISAEGTGQDGLTSEGETYEGTGTVQDSHADGNVKLFDLLQSESFGDSDADGDIKVIDLLKSDAEVKGKPSKGK